ncbi:hypothetical protein QEN19_001610 [Hanseniaspora menglaensis]
MSLNETFNNLANTNGYKNVKTQWPLISKISNTDSLDFNSIVPYYFGPTMSVGKIDPALLLLYEKPFNSKYNTFTQFLLYATEKLFYKLNLSSNNVLKENNDLGLNSENTGSSIGTGIISIEDALQATTSMVPPVIQKNKKLSPHFIPKILPNMAPANLHINYKLKGPILTTSTACATGTQSIIDGYRYLQNEDDFDETEHMIVGASEASGHALSIAGFQRLRAMSVKGVSKPFDVERDGFVLSEGCGVMLLSKSNISNVKENDICIVGSGLTSDGYHLTSPLPDGDGGYRAMKKACKNTVLFENLEKNKMYNLYVNCHATSTKVGDLSEIKAIIKLFGGAKNLNVYVVSSKGALGHSLGASGAIEACICYQTLKTNTILPTKNLKHIDQEIASLLPENIKILTEADGPLKLEKIDFAMNNSFGFGGVNSSVLLYKV